MIYKALEISYETGSLPANVRGDLVDFRNMALAHIDAAFTEADVGEWEGTEVEGDKTVFSFHVLDFDRAEAILKRALMGTPYAAIAALHRVETTHEELVPELARKEERRGFALGLGSLPAVIGSVVSPARPDLGPEPAKA